MSEIYKLEMSGQVPKLLPGQKCDMKTNPLVDDCRGEMCDECKRDVQLYEADKLIRKLHLWMVEIYETTQVYPAHLRRTSAYVQKYKEQK